MRLKNVVFVSGVVMVSGLLATPTRASDRDHKTSKHDKDCRGVSWTVRVAQGPCAVYDTAQPSCQDPGPFTGIQYEVTGPTDYAATLVTRNNEVSAATGNTSYAACDGDPVTGLGEDSCHEKAVSVNRLLLPGRFWVVVDGQKSPIETSIVLKKGWCSQSFAVQGLGLEGPNPFRLARRTETVNFKGCEVLFEIDPETDEVVSARLTPESLKAGCESPSQTSDGVIEPMSADAAELSVNGQSYGFGKWGDGYFSTGENSCTTRIIGGRLYSWGNPCP